MIENGFAAEGLRKCVCNTNLPSPHKIDHDSMLAKFFFL